jgi:hypothetical protein
LTVPAVSATFPASIEEDFSMAVVSVSEASRLVGKTRQTLYNDRDSGKLSWTTLETGKPGIDTSELQRVYGPLKISPVKQAVSNVNFDTEDSAAAVNPTVHAVLETELKGAQQRIDLLERMLALEATARKQQLESQRAELTAKDQIINVLQSQMKLLEYMAPAKPTATEEALRERTVDMQPAERPAREVSVPMRRGWWSRFWRRAA